MHKFIAVVLVVISAIPMFVWGAGLGITSSNPFASPNDNYTMNKVTPSVIDLSTGYIRDNGTTIDNLTRGQIVVLDNTSRWRKALAITIDNSTGYLGLVIDNVTVDNVSVPKAVNLCIYGNCNIMTGLTVGSAYYVDNVTKGNVTVTAPTMTGNVVRHVGFSKSSTNMFFNPASHWTVK